MYWYKFFTPASPLVEDYSTLVQVSLLFRETANEDVAASLQLDDC